MCAEASAKEAVRLMTEAETQTALAEALVLRVVARKHLLLEYPCLNAEQSREDKRGEAGGPPSIIPSAAREGQSLAKAASREANSERGDGRSRGLAPSPALVQLLNKESSDISRARRCHRHQLE